MKFTRLLAALLTAVSLISCQQTPPTDTAEIAAKPSPFQAIAEFFAPEPKIQENALVFLACSDLQSSSGHETACAHVQLILDEIRDAGYDRADGAFFCGDYNWDFDGSVPGLYHLRKTVSDPSTVWNWMISSSYRGTMTPPIPPDCLPAVPTIRMISACSSSTTTIICGTTRKNSRLSTRRSG